MHRVMQHRASGMFLARNGLLTPYIWEAFEFASLSSAIRECNRHHFARSEFSFRVFEQEPGEDLQMLLPHTR